MSKLIETIEARIASIQKTLATSEENVKQTENLLDRQTHDSALKVIEILDMIETVRSSCEAETTTQTISTLLITKIEKKLNELLRRWQVEIIDLSSGHVEIGKVRVLETRKIDGHASTNTIIDVCRKGYQRGNKIIRPADVITREH